MDFPPVSGRSQTADVRKVARLYLAKVDAGSRLATVIEISEVLGFEFPRVIDYGKLTPDQRADERMWSRYCVSLWEAAPGYLENLLADPKPEPQKPPGRPLWERLDDD